MYFSECKHCSAVTQVRFGLVQCLWAAPVLGAGAVSPLGHVQQTSTGHFKNCQMQRRAQTILNKLPEIHKQQLPPLCARTQCHFGRFLWHFPLMYWLSHSRWSSVFSACPQHLFPSLKEKPAEPPGSAKPRKLEMKCCHRKAAANQLFLG